MTSTQLFGKANSIKSFKEYGIGTKALIDNTSPKMFTNESNSNITSDNIMAIKVDTLKEKKVDNNSGLGKCEGDCDAGECNAGLKCFQREKGEMVPGCASKSKKHNDSFKTWDYCYDRDLCIAIEEFYDKRCWTSYNQDSVEMYLEDNDVSCWPLSSCKSDDPKRLVGGKCWEKGGKYIQKKHVGQAIIRMQFNERL